MFRLGATSYVIPADLRSNVEWLAGKVEDVQLVLFETDADGSNLPDAALRTRLRELADEHGLTYTVHLPLDLELPGRGARGREAVAAARRVIAATLDLEPFGYTVHLDGRGLPCSLGGDGSLGLAQWHDEAAAALAEVARNLPDPRLLCVENLEGWDPAALEPLLRRLPVSRTVDVGHLWLRGRPVLPTVAEWLPRTRVVHLHGVGTRDHQSLAHAPRAELRALLELLRARFDGVVTLEVFSEADFAGSRELVMASGRPAPWETA